MATSIISEGHILEDVNKCILALQERDPDMLDRTAGAIRGRCGRLCNVVATEMMNFEPGPYTERVMEAVLVLRDQSMLWFFILGSVNEHKKYVFCLV
jgi:catenin alpha